jgi:hypothetical protein
MTHMHSFRPAVARLLLLIQLFMLTNAVVFRHAHRLPDGTIVVHAHPFLPKALGGDTADPIQPNNHTRQELIWLDAIAYAPYLHTDPPAFGWLVVPTLLPDDPIPVSPGQVFYTEVRYVFPRGPPVHYAA